MIKIIQFPLHPFIFCTFVPIFVQGEMKPFLPVPLWGYYCPFVKEIHQWPMDSFHKRPALQSFGIFREVNLNMLLNKHTICQWFEMQ